MDFGALLPCFGFSSGSWVLRVPACAYLGRVSRGGVLDSPFSSGITAFLFKRVVRGACHFIQSSLDKKHVLGPSFGGFFLSYINALMAVYDLPDEIVGHSARCPLHLLTSVFLTLKLLLK